MRRAVPGPIRRLLADARGCGPRCARIALVVGTVLTLVNQGTAVLDPTPELVARTCANYLIPFLVSSLGWVTSQRALRRRLATTRTSGAEHDAWRAAGLLGHVSPTAPVQVLQTRDGAAARGHGPVDAAA